MTHYTELPPPLVGCLYCHTEGTITEHLPGRFSRSGLPRLVCSHCGAVASFEAADNDQWRIQYQQVNEAPPYFYAALVLKNTGWIDADTAIDLSRDAYIQRRRVEQVQAGQLNWLQPTLPDEGRPANLSPDEHLLVYIEAAQLKRKIETEEEHTTHDVDNGALFFSNRKIHLIGQQREWAYEYAAIINTHYQPDLWRMTFSDAHFIEHTVQSKELDAQLLIAVVEALRSGGGRFLNNR